MEEKNKGGRPPMYKTVEEMQKKIDEYFEECDGHQMVDGEGKPMFYPNGEPIITGKRPYTITGLALALGFNTRLSLLNYEGKPAFMNTVRRAKARVERYAEERLFDKEGANGAKFSLSNNFRGWKENQSVELSGAVVIEGDVKD